MERVYLRAREAVDVARVCDLPLSYARTRIWDEADVGWEAAYHMVQRGLWRPDDVILDVSRLDGWTQLRVVFARIGLLLERAEYEASAFASVQNS